LMGGVVAFDFGRNEPVQDRIDPGRKDHEPVCGARQCGGEGTSHTATFAVCELAGLSPILSRGNTSSTFVPRPCVLSRRSAPPCVSIMALTRARPSPVPRCCRFNGLS